MPGGRGCAFKVFGHRAGAAHEGGKAGVARADDTPQEAEDNQAQRRTAKAYVPVHIQAAQLDADKRADNTDD
ncbi:hypothetical protein D3C72_885100 [compost metagenome]